MRFLQKCLPVALLAFAIGCGGSSGSDFLGAATISIRVVPSVIDTGDRVRVIITIDDVNENGIALKVRAPMQLDYVPDSSTLDTDGSDDPLPEPQMFTIDDDNYLIYYLAQSLFGDDGFRSGILVFEFEANNETEEALVEADADVDDPLISNATEFNPDNPEFSAEDFAVVIITD